MAEQAVYSAPEAELATPTTTEFGGFNRMQYFLISLAIGVGNMILTAMFIDAPTVGLVSMGIALIASIYVVVMRLKNLGSSGWWALGFLVPLLNIWIGLKCLAFPEGYQEHKTLDTPGKVITGLFVGFFVLGIAAAVVLPMMMASG